MALLNFPVGTIILWENLAIPAGWQICDGTNGTPNLVDKFVYGASVDGDLGVTGGATTHTHTNSNTNSRAAHDHGGSVNGSVNNGGSVWQTTGSGESPATSGHSHSVSASISSANSHSHTIGSTGSASSIPKHIARVFIQRMT
jgi:hypothetical protein